MVMMTQNDTIFCVIVYLGNMAPTPNCHVTSLCCSHVLSCLSRLVCSHQPFTMVNDMARSIDRRFYESPEWRRCKAEYLTHVNHLCERCLAKGIYQPAKIVHHKVYLTAENYGDAELMFGFDNLEALCQACHNDEHGRAKNERRWKFVDGELVTNESPSVKS